VYFLLCYAYVSILLLCLDSQADEVDRAGNDDEEN